VANHGSSGFTNRDKPKSVSFTNGPEDHGSAACRSLDKRMSGERISRRRGNRREKGLTLEFDVTMNQGDAMHPSDSLAQFAPYLSQMGFVELRVLLIGIDEVEQLRSVYVLQHEAVVRRRGERMHERHDVWVANVLKIGVSLRRGGVANNR
jgi:hypothetical protein